MITLPATAGATTTRLHHIGRAGAYAAALAALAVLAFDLAAIAGWGTGAHKSLLALTGITAVGAAALIGAADMRAMVATATTAVTAEQAQHAELLRAAVAELGRQRQAERDRDELTARLVEAWASLPQRIADAEARGYARALAAVREGGREERSPVRIVRQG